ncbi:MAG: ribosome small subunit-dependent GTPase A, partial [Romboutsia sp.]|uniref:ribosome small subunit-dependent GTPase A n=1 Tax=Romboutsia sp. TaxID=1965302 RepID=UPI003F3CC3E1
SLTGDGVDEVRGAIDAYESVVFIGSSGVGKSTLINKLMGSSTQLTSEIGDNGKGRHTTTHRELLVLPDGGVIIDTPGMREIQLSTGDIENTFRDIEELAKECYFSDCNHKTEPRCAIKDAIERGILSIERLKSYEKLKRELFYAEKRRISKEKSKLKKATGGK